MANLQSKVAAPKSKATAVKTAKTSAETTVKPQPHRFRVSVPAADEAVLEWMNLQDNPSLSVRMLIRESIERLGYLDVFNRPVAQLPPRGRPVGPEEVSPETERNEETAAAPVPLVQKPAPKHDDIHTSSSTAPEPEAAPEPEQPDVGQLGVNDIFSMLR